jgi:asparagine synthase (glutamine-hydrolysing)
MQRYYSLFPAREPREIEDGAAAEQVLDLLRQSVTRRLRSDVPLGSSLSGGMDSTAIVSLIDGLADSDQPLKVFSARFDDAARDEGPWIEKALAQVRAEPHETRPSAEDLVDALSRVFYHQEEPFGSASILAQWKVMELASEAGVTVLLDGQGADEMFAGYPPMYRSRFLELYRTDRKLFDRERAAYVARHGRAWPLTFGMRFIADSISPEAVRLGGRVRRAVTAPEYLRPFAPDFAGAHRNAPPPFVTHRNLDDALLHAVMRQGLPALLRYADRNAMAFGREVRLPYLSHELVELAFTLPPGMKLRDGWTKWILRSAVEGIIPGEIAWREDKLGYEPPQADWLADPRIVERTRAGRELLVERGILRDVESGDPWPVLMASELFAFAAGFPEGTA